MERRWSSGSRRSEVRWEGVKERGRRQSGGTISLSVDKTELSSFVCFPIKDIWIKYWDIYHEAWHRYFGVRAFVYFDLSKRKHLVHEINKYLQYMLVCSLVEVLMGGHC